jgi:hypothetical protein
MVSTMVSSQKKEFNDAFSLTSIHALSTIFQRSFLPLHLMKSARFFCSTATDSI